MKTKLILLLLLGLLFSCSSNDELIFKKETNTTQKKELLKPIVFITGIDKGDNHFYQNATNFFLEKDYIIVENTTSLESIINWMNSNYKNGIYTDIHIVSHSNSWRGMSLKTSNDTLERINYQTLNKAVNKQNIPKLEADLAENSKLIFHSCGLGNNPKLVSLLKSVFSSNYTPITYVSQHYNVFDNKKQHYLAKTYYVYYPTAHSTGKLDLSKELAQKYPDVKMDWFDALYRYKNSELDKETSYSYKFNVPLEWQFTFNSKAEIPELKDKEAIMDFVSEQEEIAIELYKMNIPLEKYRWKSAIKDSILTIKAKSTVTCILQPIMNDNNKEYKELDYNDANLYQKF